MTELSVGPAQRHQQALALLVPRVPYVQRRKFPIEPFEVGFRFSVPADTNEGLRLLHPAGPPVIPRRDGPLQQPKRGRAERGKAEGGDEQQRRSEIEPGEHPLMPPDQLPHAERGGPPVPLHTSMFSCPVSLTGKSRGIP